MLQKNCKMFSHLFVLNKFQQRQCWCRRLHNVQQITYFSSHCLNNTQMWLNTLPYIVFMLFVFWRVPRPALFLKVKNAPCTFSGMKNKPCPFPTISRARKTTDFCSKTSFCFYVEKHLIKEVKNFWCHDRDCVSTATHSSKKFNTRMFLNIYLKTVPPSCKNA